LLSGAVNIDLGGIGKGFALDKMAALLADWDITTALLSCSSTVLPAGFPERYPDLCGLVLGPALDGPPGERLIGRLPDPARARTNNILSMILDFPDPLGPEMTVNPSKKGILVTPQKDLKLLISSWVIFNQ
jgi:hypothetical protein